MFDNVTENTIEETVIMIFALVSTHQSQVHDIGLIQSEDVISTADEGTSSK